MSELRLTDVRLSHFRSHLDSRLILDGRPIVLYGSNGSGKTNILEAISMLSPGRGIRNSKVTEMIKTPEVVGWKVSAVLSSMGVQNSIESRIEPSSNRIVIIDGKIVPQLALGKLFRVIWLVPTMDRLWVDGSESRRRFLDRLTNSLQPAHGSLLLKYEKAMRERNFLLREGVGDLNWYRALEDQMASAGAEIVSNRADVLNKLTSAIASSETEFPEADLFVQNLTDEYLFDTVEDLREAFEKFRQKDIKAGRTLIGPHRVDLLVRYKEKDMDAKFCSTGEQKALLISIILANARAIIKEFGNPPIILLDEIFAHLDKERQSALYAEILALKAQAWMTGTGSELFREIEDVSQQFSVSQTEGYSNIVQVK